MRDQISISRINLLHPDVRKMFTDFITECETALNITIRVVQGLRTFEEQQSIYDQGRTKPGKIVSNAKPGSSYHNFGLAVDLGIIENGKINWDFDYSRLLLFMPSSFFWGGNFKSIKDKPHFEISFGHTWRQLLEKYNAKQFIPGTKYVQI